MLREPAAAKCSRRNSTKLRPADPQRRARGQQRDRRPGENARDPAVPARRVQPPPGEQRDRQRVQEQQLLRIAEQAAAQRGGQLRELAAGPGQQERRAGQDGPARTAPERGAGQHRRHHAAVQRIDVRNLRSHPLRPEPETAQVGGPPPRQRYDELEQPEGGECVPTDLAGAESVGGAEAEGQDARGGDDLRRRDEQPEAADPERRRQPGAPAVPLLRHQRHRHRHQGRRDRLAGEQHQAAGHAPQRHAAAPAARHSPEHPGRPGADAEQVVEGQHGEEEARRGPDQGRHQRALLALPQLGAELARAEEAEQPVQREVELERGAEGQQQIEEVVRIERDRVGVAAERLAQAPGRIDRRDPAVRQLGGAEELEVPVRRQHVAQHQHPVAVEPGPDDPRPDQHQREEQKMRRTDPPARRVEPSGDAPPLSAADLVAHRGPPAVPLPAPTA